MIALAGCQVIDMESGRPSEASIPDDMLRQSFEQNRQPMTQNVASPSREELSEDVLVDEGVIVNEVPGYYESLVDSPISTDSAVALDEAEFFGQCESPWRPPGISGPWPPEEYLCDGGDYQLPARVRADWTVDGVEQEDTIAHFDTLDGRTIVQPSNRVCIYAPRFAAVRRVDNLLASESLNRAGGTHTKVSPGRQEELGVVTTSLQNQQPIGEVGTKAFDLYRRRQQGGEMARHQHLDSLHDGLMPFEDFSIIRLGLIDQAEKPRLAIYTDAALAWNRAEAVQVMIKGQPADQIIVDWQPEAVYRFEKDPQPEIRVVKVASTDIAKPGEVIDFTIRFDNTGNEPIGNVTIIDNLSTRLEYINESESSTLEADFYARPNQGGSSSLRWDITAPVKPGEGGVVRFRCKVR